MSFRRGMLCLPVLVIAIAAAIAGCGGGGSNATTGSGSGGSEDGGSAQFPASKYPASVYKGLKGKLVYYDTSGGAATKAMDATVSKDFTALTGVPVVNDFNADMTKFMTAMQAGQSQWDVIEIPTKADVAQAEKKGYLEKLDTSIIPVDQLEPGNSDPYSYGVHRYGIVLAWNTDKFPKSGPQPTSMADLYNTQRFPGKRCMFKYPEFGATLESALVADGVKAADMYPLDVNRAFRKLDTIKKDIVWWDSGDQAIQYLTSGECDIGVAWSGRLFDAVNNDKAPLAFTFNGGMYATGSYAIPKNAPNPKAAQAYLAHFIVNLDAQRRWLEKIPYPAPIKGLQVPAITKTWVPVGANVKDAFQQDDVWYGQHIDELSKQFTKWLGS
jgi:putative spermidine/putrescine transport system substrate-binding protein